MLLLTSDPIHLTFFGPLEGLGYLVLAYRIAKVLFGGFSAITLFLVGGRGPFLSGGIVKF